ncbi:MAG: capsule biosynthesis protein [Rubellimicrobium sp.]|nr:capsule biosynthesis protein [Rubellimicrobium sp.]
MTTKPRAVKYRIRRGEPLAPGLEGREPAPAPGARPAAPAPADLDAIRAEELTGRQLRMARRVAQKHGLTVDSDLDAVRQLRARGIDPFRTSQILELVRPDPQGKAPEGRVQLPQAVTRPRDQLPSTARTAPDPVAAGQGHAAEIMRIQRDIARRRQRKVASLFTRLFFLVLLPTIAVGWYFAAIATPMYATDSAFVIQQTQPQGALPGFGSLLQGTAMATQQDSMAVQDYLTSREAMMRLDADGAFRDHFSQPSIDPIQRLPEGATSEDLYKIYRDRVRISYDPTEGIIRMEVVAADPATSQAFSEELIRYAEEQVDQMSLRLRDAQMEDARAAYQAAEDRRSDALQAWLAAQEQAQQIDPVGETAARTTQISALETERQQLQLQLEQRLSVARPNEAQVENLRSQITNIEGLIANLRTQMTQADTAGSSLAARNTELRLAEENYTFQTLMVQQALAAMETARVEANRQVRYLATGVPPVAPDVATYPRVFENTLLAFLVFSGIYLMLSLTASILREQVTS